MDVEKIGALGMVVLASAVVAWLALQGNEAAQGAIIAVVSSGTGYFLRGKVEPK